MAKLPKTLYHASYAVVDKISLLKCRDGLDFGKGFYTTDDYNQAKSFVKNAIKKGKSIGAIAKNIAYGYINIFELVSADDLNIYKFADADAKWLHYVASNRSDSLFSSENKKLNGYDLLIGKIANDKTAETLNNYVSEAYGTPGDKTVDDFTIKRLMTNVLKDQYCFKTNAAIKHLKYLKSDKIYV